MEHINRRELLQTTGVGAGMALGAGAASGEESIRSSDPVQATQAAVSTFTATATNASLAIDVDDPTDESNRIPLDTGSPLVELSGNTQQGIPNPVINDDGTLVANPDQINVPDLVDVILGLDPTGIIADIINGIDIQQDIIDALDLQADVVDPLVDFINQLGLSDTQASAIGQLVDILDQELGLLPSGIGDLIDVQQFLTGLLLNPGSETAGIPALLTLLQVSDMQGLVDTVIGLINQAVFTGTVEFSFTLPDTEATYSYGVFSNDGSATGEITVGSPNSTTTAESLGTEQTQAVFEVSGLSAPDNPGPGDIITVSANLINTGDQADIQDIEFQFDGTVEGTKSKELQPSIQSYGDLKQFIIDQVQAFDLASILGSVSLETELNSIEGEVDPDPDAVDHLLVSFPLGTATITPTIDLPDAPQNLPPVDFELGIDLTTGESGALTGNFSENADGPGLGPTGTVVDNQFTADITEFDLLGIVNELDFVALLEFAFGSLGINPGDYPDFTVQGFVDDADIPSIVENAELLGLLDDQITDQPGRHVVTADVDFSFEDLDAVLDISLGPPPLPGNESQPQDLDFTPDGTFEDVDGNGEFNIFDVQAFFINFNSGPVQDNAGAFKFSDPDAENPGEVNIFDVQSLFLALSG